jgi:O-acetyl-ADP-ribose deacetylase (regulator of RNase III)
MEKKEQPYMFGKSKVVVRIGDITTSTAEVIVSSDDTELSATGGVSKSIKEAPGGDAIYRDAEKHRPAKIGQVVVTTAGDMPGVRHIFHAITRVKGSTRSEDREQNKAIIQSATRQCLHLLRDLRLSSIAFPALGTGFAGFEPADVAVEMAKVIIEELASFGYPIEVTIYLLPKSLGTHVDFQDFFNRFDGRTGLTPDVSKNHVVVMIHGIRTDARWFDSVEKLLNQADPHLYPVGKGYGYFDLFRFLLPISSLRQAVVRRVKGDVDKLLGMGFPQVSIIAHSFGSYIVGEMLRSDPKMKLHRLILCGAILPPAYDWGQYKEQISPLPNDPARRIINDCGWHDVWPVLAESITWGYGSSGRFGFLTPWVRDRFHAVGHSDFFKEDIVKTFWLPLLSDGKVIDGPVGRPASAWWLQLLTVLKLKYVVVAIVLALVLWFFV